jgi:CheY-like chemotaxis protein
VKHVLEARNATVITASGASEGLVLIEQERPEVILSDIGMPEMDGYDFMRQVRALGKSRGGGVPAIALTAFARSEDRQRALLSGYQSHISKPMEAAELVAVVASVTGLVYPQ